MVIEATATLMSSPLLLLPASSPPSPPPFFLEAEVRGGEKKEAECRKRRGEGGGAGGWLLYIKLWPFRVEAKTGDMLMISLNCQGKGNHSTLKKGPL